VQDIAKCIRIAADAAADAALATCRCCDWEGCINCHTARHDSTNPRVDHLSVCIGTGVEPDALAHLLIGYEEPWAAEALQLLAGPHLDPDDDDLTEAPELVRCERYERTEPCAVLDVYLSSREDAWSESHTAHQDGDCSRCEQNAALGNEFIR
jgi:hypothetical protein